MLVGLGPLHVPEGVDHLARGVHLLHLHLVDLNTGTVIVENPLQQLDTSLLHIAPALFQDVLDEHAGNDFCRDAGGPLVPWLLDRGSANNFAHGAFGGRLHGLRGIADVEQVFARVLDDPEHRELNLDDVLVAGQHQAFFGNAAGADSGGSSRGAEADIFAVDPRDFRRQHPFKWRRCLKVKTGRCGPHELAEAEDHALLVGLDPVHHGKSPENQGKDQQYEDTPTGAEATGDEPAQLVLTPAHEFFEVGGFAAGPARTPGPLTAAAAATTASAAAPGAASSSALIAPRHGCHLSVKMGI